LWIAILLALLGLLQYRLWIADGGIPSNHRLKIEVRQDHTRNLSLQARNDAVKAQVANLKSGSAAIAGLARDELGMVRPDESFFLLVKSPAPAKKSGNITLQEH
jgi:cell division protein FtsB